MKIKNLFYRKFWDNKKVLITGHNGFKGSWLSIFLISLGADVSGISLENNLSESLFNNLEIKDLINEEIFDIRNLIKTKKVIKEFSPDIVFHLAAQPLVRESYLNPVETWSTNVMGTISVLEAAKELQKKITFIGITTDKVYENKEWIYGYRENDRLGGNDPYSSSKSAAELAINAWRESFAKNSEFKLASARAGNVIGGGDFAEDRIIPDIVRSIIHDSCLNIRNPISTRPWQHVIEPLWGYILMAEKMSKGINFSKSYNFGPDVYSNKTVIELVKEFSKMIPFEYKIEQNENNLKESNLLNLVSEKAKNELSWLPIWSFEETIYKTAAWYDKTINKKIHPLECCLDDITDFMKNQKNEK